MFDYSIDSDDEWEEPGESLSDSEVSGRDFNYRKTKQAMTLIFAIQLHDI